LKPADQSPGQKSIDRTDDFKLETREPPDGGSAGISDPISYVAEADEPQQLHRSDGDAEHASQLQAEARVQEEISNQTTMTSQPDGSSTANIELGGFVVAADEPLLRGGADSTGAGSSSEAGDGEGAGRPADDEPARAVSVDSDDDGVPDQTDSDDVYRSGGYERSDDEPARAVSVDSDGDGLPDQTQSDDVYRAGMAQQDQDNDQDSMPEQNQ
jgi:hypothetical protein